MSRSLPGNLKCQDLLVDPFSLENPGETGYIESASADTSAEQSCSWCRWMSYHWPHGPSRPLGSDKADHSVFSNLPRLTQVPLLTLNPLEKRHQWAGIQWARNTVSASNPPGMTSRTQALQLATKVHSKIQDNNARYSKWAMLQPESSEPSHLCSWSSSFSNFARFTLLTLVEEKKKSNRVVNGDKELPDCGKWIKFGAVCWGTHPNTYQSRVPRRSLLAA